MSFRNYLQNMSRSSWKTKKRPVGRGYGSGKGRTSAKGHKGQLGMNSNVRAGFEGGQTPIYRRLPKRGGTIGTNRRFYRMFTINARDVAKKFESSEELNHEALRNKFKIPFYYKRLKIIGIDKVKFKSFTTPQRFKIPVKKAQFKRNFKTNDNEQIKEQQINEQ